MNQRFLARFEIIPRAHRATDLVPRIRALSKAFKIALLAGDQGEAERISEQAWNLLGNLFEILRNEEDQGRLDGSYMHLDTGHIVNGLSAEESREMILARRIDRRHSRCANLSLRNCLNKVAHFDSIAATYRIDGRGAHYLVLGGKFHGQNWVAEILVSKLCDRSQRAVQAIRAS